MAISYEKNLAGEADFAGLVDDLALPLLVATQESCTLLYANRSARRQFQLASYARLPEMVQLLGNAGYSELVTALQGAERRSVRLTLPAASASIDSTTSATTVSAALADVQVSRLTWAGQEAVALLFVVPCEVPAPSCNPLYQQMFSTNPAIKLLVEPHSGRIIDANASAAAFYGYSLDTLKRMNVAEINCLPPGEIQLRMQAARDRRQQFFEFRHRTAAGDIRDVHVYAGPVTVDEREYLYSIIVDVTDRVRYYSQLEGYNELFQHLPLGVYRNTIGPRGRFATVNPAMLRLLEADSEAQLLATSIVSLFDSAEQHRQLGAVLERHASVTRMPLRLRTLKGRLIHVEMTAHRTCSPDGTVAYNGVVEDVTARNAVQRNQQRLIHLLDASPDFVSITDAAQQVVYLNKAGRAMLHCQDVPLHLPDALAQAHPAWARRLIEQEGIPHALKHGHWYAETALNGPEGEVPVSQLIVVRRDEEGELDCIATIMRDISETKRYQAELEHLAGHDSLTGAVNRNRFLGVLRRERERARRHGGTISLVMFDIDHFKRVNDTFGHSVGDDVLRQLVTLCGAMLREVDVLARWGGEEFMLLLPETSLGGAEALAERLRRAIEVSDFAPVERLTCSFGVAELMAQEAESACFLRLDAALYQAKASGRNRTCLAADRPPA
ncbi:sensor domain-containing diguanylate cyclase [Halomonas sp. E14]|uniref:sensor domain-containing diguanylate cyclase n=1 Tax=Halomonas sp. E14 TaxID=3397245 RepID=UPI00403EE644